MKVEAGLGQISVIHSLIDAAGQLREALNFRILPCGGLSKNVNRGWNLRSFFVEGIQNFDRRTRPQEDEMGSRGSELDAKQTLYHGSGGSIVGRPGNKNGIVPQHTFNVLLAVRIA